MLLWTFMYKFLCLQRFSFLLDYIHGSWIIGSYGTVGGITRMFSKMAALFYILTSNVWGFNFSKYSHTLFFFLNSSHPSGYEVACHCGFDFHFPDVWWCWVSFHVFIGHLYIFFGGLSIHIFCPSILKFFIELYKFFTYSRCKSLII